MATKLSKPVIRAVTVKSDVSEGEVSVTMSSNGIAFHRGKRKLGSVPWEVIGKAAQLPTNAPAKFTADPLGWLLENT